VHDKAAGEAPQSVTDRMLATVLFTDIVSSTETDFRVGDHRWRELLDQHDNVAKRRIARHRGRFVKTTGDGLLATFDGPARAITCAQEIALGATPLGLDIRAGLHTGEVELRGDDITGLGVVIARRVCDLAAADELLASRTVKDQVIGSGIGFVDRGVHTLKGVPDDWQLYAVSGSSGRRSGFRCAAAVLRCVRDRGRCRRRRTRCWRWRRRDRYVRRRR
jgi:class 3 adenylate cyclase